MKTLNKPPFEILGQSLRPIRFHLALTYAGCFIFTTDDSKTQSTDNEKSFLSEFIIA